MSRLDDVIGDVYYVKDCLMTLRSILNSGCCNECEHKRYNTCGFCPEAGQLVRYNCPLFQRIKEENGEKSRSD